MARLDRARDTWRLSGSGAWPPAGARQTPADEAPQAGAPDAWAEAWLNLLREHGAPGPVVLGLPTSRLLVKLLKLPAAARAELIDAVTLQMDKLSPFAGDELTVSCELLAETESDLTVLAVAAPSAIFAPMESPLAAAGVRVTRVDAALLGWWRALRDHAALKPVEGRCAWLVCMANEWDLAIIDNGVPVFVRGLGAVETDADLCRELTLSLLHAEIETGSVALREVVVVAAGQSDPRVAELRAATGVAVRQVIPEDAAWDALGIAWRAADGSAALDLTPASWRNRTAGAAARRRFLRGLGAAVFVWTVLAGVLYAGPEVMGRMVAWRERQMTGIAEDYRSVANARDRVKLIRAYMDRSHSVLESLRTVTSVQPNGVDLTSLTYRRGESVKLTGEAQDPALVYAFKDGLENNVPFGLCTLGAVSFDGTKRKHRFEMDVRFKTGGAP